MPVCLPNWVTVKQCRLQEALYRHARCPSLWGWCELSQVGIDGTMASDLIPGCPTRHSLLPLLSSALQPQAVPGCPMLPSSVAMARKLQHTHPHPHPPPPSQKEIVLCSWYNRWRHSDMSFEYHTARWPSKTGGPPRRVTGKPRRVTEVLTSGPLLCQAASGHLMRWPKTTYTSWFLFSLLRSTHVQMTIILRRPHNPTVTPTNWTQQSTKKT